jgi:hypothetical protein
MTPKGFGAKEGQNKNRKEKHKTKNKGRKMNSLTESKKIRIFREHGSANSRKQ